MNEATASGTSSPTVTVQQHTMHLTVGGSTTILGGQLINIHVDLVDDATASAFVSNQGN